MNLGSYGKILLGAETKILMGNNKNNGVSAVFLFLNCLFDLQHQIGKASSLIFLTYLPTSPVAEA